MYLEFYCPECECEFVWRCVTEPCGHFRACTTVYGKHKEEDFIGTQDHPKFCPTCGSFEAVKRKTEPPEEAHVGLGNS